MLQPIGLAHHTTEKRIVSATTTTNNTSTATDAWRGLNRGATWMWVGDWAKEMTETNKCDNPDLLKRLHDNMFVYDDAPAADPTSGGGGDDVTTTKVPRDFVFSINRQDAARIPHELLILMGKDIYHPSETSREIARTVPNAKLIERWRDDGPEIMADAVTKIESFLS